LDQIHDEEQGGTSNQIGADDVEENGKRRSGDELSVSKLAYDEEQRELRAEFLSSTKEAQDGDSDGNENSDNDDDDDGGFMPSRKTAKTAQELEEEEVMLQKEFEKLEKTRSKATPIKDPRGEVKDSETFLMDFIKNKQWIDKTMQDASDDDDDDDEDESPKRGTDEGAGIAEDGNETDDSMDDKMDAFESKYNFRFEEAAATSGATHSVVGYSRNSAAVTDTLRRKDDSRRQKRLARKERKEAERKAKEEQLRRLKNAKRQEMEGKIKQIKAVLGDGKGDGDNFDDTVMMKLMEGDYDPEKFEEMMANAYGDDFYETEDAEWKKDMDVRESLKKDTDTVEIMDDAEGDLYDNYDDTNDEDVAYAPDGGNYEDDNEDGNEEELQTAKKESKVERKLKAKMLDELYKLDYEDMIGDMPTRFKYRQVEANSYGLSTEEILFAKDTTLKQFVSLKKMAPYGDEVSKCSMISSYGYYNGSIIDILFPSLLRVVGFICD
jgi:protein KRI1